MKFGRFVIFLSLMFAGSVSAEAASYVDIHFSKDFKELEAVHMDGKAIPAKLLKASFDEHGVFWASVLLKNARKEELKQFVKTNIFTAFRQDSKIEDLGKFWPNGVMDSSVEFFVAAKESEAMSEPGKKATVVVVKIRGYGKAAPEKNRPIQ